MIRIENCKIVDIEELPPYSKENPVWIKNIFVGPPPLEYASWQDWVNKSHSTGLFMGVYIEAIK